MTAAELAHYIDHTLLKPDAVPNDIGQLCQEAATHQFRSVCVNPCYVPLAVECLGGSEVGICTVIGFPLGANDKGAKGGETILAIEQGATEIDMVLNIGSLKAGEFDSVRGDIRAVVRAAAGRALVKVIFETCLLTPDEIRMACQLSEEAGAQFVKTSTGFSTGGATLDTVRLMRECVGDRLGVKASGGIRDRATALAMIEAGATRLGTSASVHIVTGADQVGQGY